MPVKISAASPVMGWNSWDCYGCAVNEEQLLASARRMKDLLLPCGWDHVVCDIQWYEPRAVGNDYNDYARLCTDGCSRLIPDPVRFPSSAGGQGFAPLAGRIHAMGLKFGVHLMKGIPRQCVHEHAPILTHDLRAHITADMIASRYDCPWNTDMYGINAAAPGAADYYDSVFALLASWGVDFVKVDDCCVTEGSPDDRYSGRDEIELIRAAIDKSGREMTLSLSPGPADTNNAAHLAANADMWRISGDFWDDWDKLKAMFALCGKWYPYVRPGARPDCDMLPLGRLCLTDRDPSRRGRHSRFTPDEAVTMMTLWCVFTSPLILGGSLAGDDFDESMLPLLTNRAVIEVDQSALRPRPLEGFPADTPVWTADMPDGSPVLAVFDLTDEDLVVTLPAELSELQGVSSLIDLWDGKRTDVVPGKGAVIPLKRHGAALLRRSDRI